MADRAQLNVAIDGELHRRLKVYCAEYGLKQRTVVAVALAAYLDISEAGREARTRHAKS